MQVVHHSTAHITTATLKLPIYYHCPRPCNPVTVNDCYSWWLQHGPRELVCIIWRRINITCLSSKEVGRFKEHNSFLVPHWHILPFIHISRVLLSIKFISVKFMCYSDSRYFVHIRCWIVWSFNHQCSDYYMLESTQHQTVAATCLYTCQYLSSVVWAWSVHHV